jgi:hypothetical protein
MLLRNALIASIAATPTPTMPKATNIMRFCLAFT